MVENRNRRNELGRVEARTLGFGLFVGFILALSPGCPAKQTKCDPKSCQGCCSASGKCEDGIADSQCGSSGQMCSSCGTGKICKAQACVDAPPVLTTATAAQFVEKYAAAQCDWMRRCEGLDPSISDSDCRGSTNWPGEIGRLVSQGKVDIDEKVAACLLNNFAACVPAADCGALVIPKGQAGEKCVAMEHSAPQSTCSELLWCIGTASCDQRCIAGGALNEPCRYKRNTEGIISVECNDGLYCSEDERCVPLIAIGEPCDTLGTQCVSPGFCSETTQKCEMPRAVGASCEDSSLCVSTAYCGTVDGGQVCVARLAHGAACEAGYQCPLGDDCFEGICRSSNVGDPCVDTCASGLRCDEVVKTCQKLRGANLPDNSDCTADIHCAHQYCRGVFVNPDGGPGTSGKCGTRMPSDPCEFDDHCPRAEYCELGTRKCTTAKVGTPCTNSKSCQSTDYCAEGSCATRVESMSPCLEGYSDACAKPGDICMIGAGETAAKCWPRGKVGDKCRPGTCRLGLKCNASGMCIAAGKSSLPCAEGQCFNSVCRAPDGGFGDPEEGICFPLPGEGGLCSTDQCAAGLTCDSANSTCAKACQ